MKFPEEFYCCFCVNRPFGRSPKKLLSSPGGLFSDAAGLLSLVRCAEFSLGLPVLLSESRDPELPSLCLRVSAAILPNDNYYTCYACWFSKTPPSACGYSFSRHLPETGSHPYLTSSAWTDSSSDFMTLSDLYCLSLDWSRIPMIGSDGLRFWSMNSLPMAWRCSRIASSIYALMVAEGVDDSGACNYAGLAAEGEFACVSTIASSLAMGRWSLAFRIGVMSSEEF